MIRYTIALTILSVAFSFVSPTCGQDLPSQVISPVDGPLEVVSTLDDCSNTQWCFNQHKTGGHVVGGGICGADDTYAWDANLNTPYHDSDNDQPVYAVAPGIVCQTFGGCLNADDSGSYGQVLIEHDYQGAKWWSGYLHLANIQVIKGQSVTQDTVLGYVSHIGVEDSVNHIHFTVYTGENSQGMLRSFDTNIIPRSGSSDRGAELQRLVHDDCVSSVSFSPDSRKLATGSFNKAQIWDVSSGEELHSLVHEGWVRSISFSPDGSKLATASDDGTARIWNVSGGEELQKLTHDGLVKSVSFSPDGSKAATASNDATARIWDVSSGEELQRLVHDDILWSASFSPDGSKVATASDDGTARIWDVSSGEELQRLVHDDCVISITFSPDGSKVATASYDGTARIWVVSGGEELHSLVHEEGVRSVSFSPDGTKVATASYDGTARIWDVSSGAVLETLVPGDYAPASLVHLSPASFSPDGNKVATSDEVNARIWDVSSGEELQKLAHGNYVWSVSFSPDSSKVATASDDGTARIWVVSG